MRDTSAPYVAKEVPFLLIALLVGTASPAGLAGQFVPDTSMSEALHLLQRATFGARPSDVDAVMELGVDEWMDVQLNPQEIDDPEVERWIAERFPAANWSPAELLERYPPNQFLVGLRRLAQDSTTSESERREARQILRRTNPGQILQQLVGARLTRAAHSERQLEEVMTQFWFDHFNVDFRKNQVRWLVGDYESNAIRPNVFGSFYDLLVATATHPAMLVYLDNAQSVAPQPATWRSLSFGQRDRLQGRGLNENYARELLELHTLGVDGGYTQTDVIEVARAFTGWGVSPPGLDRDLRRMAGSRPMTLDAVLQRIEGASYEGAYEFLFRPQMHDPEDKLVLGAGVTGSRGMDDALAILELLATHPATARHIATQLATRFVADDPPETLIDELAAVFLETDGDLGEVTRALFTSPHFFSFEMMNEKVKSPFGLVASAVRLTGAEVAGLEGAMQILVSLGEQPYSAEAPVGYPETSAEWVTGGAMLSRMDFAESFAAGEVRGIRLSGGLPPDLPGPEADVVQFLADRLLPEQDTGMLVEAIHEVLAAEWELSPREEAKRAVGLILGSPQFQRH